MPSHPREFSSHRLSRFSLLVARAIKHFPAFFTALSHLPTVMSFNLKYICTIDVTGRKNTCRDAGADSEGETEQSRLPSASQARQESVKPQTQQKCSNRKKKIDKKWNREKHFKLHIPRGQLAIYNDVRWNAHLILEKDLRLGQPYSDAQSQPDLINKHTQGHMHTELLIEFS